MGIIIAIVACMVFASGLYVNFTKPDVGPPPKIEVEKTTQRIERGKYLANHVTVCMDCHSKRDWSVFSGPLTEGSLGAGGESFDKNAGFPGNIYSTNLTPYVLSAWSDGEVYRAITAGVGKDGHAIFPVMGYQRFGKMSYEDIFSIIAYLRTLRPVKNIVPPSKLDFPVNLLNKLSPKKGVPSDQPYQKDSVKYGGYLVNAAGCIDCHSKQEKGAIVSGSEFGGGMEFKQPAGVIRAPNITMHQTAGIGAWTEEMFVQKFKSYSQPDHQNQKIAKNELNSPMPWTMYSGMKNEDLKAVYKYLKSLKLQDNKVQIREYVN